MCLCAFLGVNARPCVNLACVSIKACLYMNVCASVSTLCFHFVCNSLHYESNMCCVCVEVCKTLKCSNLYLDYGIKYMMW